MKKVVESEHSRFPVVRGGLREVVGVLSARQLLQQLARGERPDFSVGAQPPVYVPESLTGMELLENFRSSSAHMAVVVDEYGEIQGLVTPQDLLEAIAGEFKTPSVEDAWAVQRADGSWLLDGLIPVPELKDRLGFAPCNGPGGVVQCSGTGRRTNLCGVRESGVTIDEPMEYPLGAKPKMSLALASPPQ